METKKINHTLPEISDAEFEIMNILWSQSESLSAQDIADQLKGQQSWSIKTIKTMLFRLVKKNVLQFSENRREYLYSPKFQKSEYIKKESKSFLSKVFNGATSPMLMHFIKSSQLSEKEITEIQALLKEIERESK
ncbi:MAG: BlaI/MecI/CopY family transcriptional regulator [Bdellovibrionaceae bacterium]|nr:BlaI/MecI/CopY family transcriptional regulator [Pseudobdellovibrionaceae bacterium]